MARKKSRSRPFKIACCIFQEIRNRFPNATQVLAVSTMVLALVTYCGLRDNEKATVIANRAWLTPSLAEITSPIDTTTNLSFAIVYGNTGKEPALGFTAQEEAGAVPKPKGSWFTVFHKDTITDVCARTTPDTEITIYPTGPNQHIYEVSMNGPLTEDVASGEKILWVHGCFAYRSPVSGEIIHRSEYCFLFPPVMNNGKRVFKSISCMYGNKAD
jgi:hypothetical protein